MGVNKLFYFAVLFCAGCVWPAGVLALGVSEGGFSQELPADTLPGYKHAIRGNVYLDRNGNGKQDRREPGLEGIAVSDGLDVVKTNRSGAYHLPNTKKDAVFAFVHQPGNVRQSGQDFFHRLQKDAGARERFDFGLLPALPGEISSDSTVRFVQLSDSHVRNVSDRDYMRQATNEIYEMDPAPDFVVATGDLVDWGVDEHYTNYVAGMQEPPVPYFNVFGNHEIVFGPIERYYHYIGPDYYSFERAGILFLSLNCVTPSERQDAWLQNTLDLLAGGHPVVVFQHFPPSLEDLERFKKLGVKSVFSGHWHSEKEMEHAGVQSINSPTFIMGGIDASPAGFKVVNLSADGSAETGWRYGFQNKRLTIVSPREGEPVNAGYFPILVNTYDTSHEIASVSWRLGRENHPVDSGKLQRESATAWAGGRGHSHTGEHSHAGERSHTDEQHHSHREEHSHTVSPERSHPAEYDHSPLPPGDYSLEVEVTDEQGTSWKAKQQISTSDESPARPVPGADWPMFMGDAAHTGYTPQTIDHSTLRLAWSEDTGGDPDLASPVLADGHLYLSLKKRTRGRINGVAAFDPLTGERKWLFETPLAVNHSPAYAEGTLCVAEMGGRIYGLDAATGGEKWRYDLINNHGRYNYGAPAAYNGSFYAGVMRRVAKLRPKDGHLEWEKQIGPADHDWISSYGSPAVSGEFLAMSGMFFMGEAVTIASTADGSRIWGHNADNGMLASVTIAGDRVLYASMKSILYAKQLSDGKELWSQKLGAEGGDANWSATTPAVKLTGEGMGIVVAGSGDGRMSGVNLADGKILWTHVSGPAVYKMSPYRRDDRPLLSSPTIAGNNVFFGSADGHIYCLDLGSGEVLWSFDIGVPVMSSPLVTGNVVYVAAYDGRLYAFTSGTGK